MPLTFCSLLDFDHRAWSYPERAEREMNEATTLAKEHYGPFMQIWCNCYMGWLYIWLDYRDKARECCMQANQLSRENSIEYAFS